MAPPGGLSRGQKGISEAGGGHVEDSVWGGRGGVEGRVPTSDKLSDLTGNEVRRCLAQRGGGDGPQTNMLRSPLRGQRLKTPDPHKLVFFPDNGFLLASCRKVSGIMTTPADLSPHPNLPPLAVTVALFSLR